MNRLNLCLCFIKRAIKEFSLWMRRVGRLRLVFSDQVAPRVGRDPHGKEYVYTLYHAAPAAMYAFAIDMSELKGGDEIILELYTTIAGREVLCERWSIRDKQDLPGYTLPPRWLVAPRLTLKQTTGLTKTLRFDVYSDEDAPCLT